MPNPNKWADFMGDKELLEDAAFTQSQAALSCTLTALHCTDIRASRVLANILSDELAICRELSQDLQAHGWQDSGQITRMHLDRLQPNNGTIPES